MHVVEYLVIFAILLAVVAFVSAPVRRALAPGSEESRVDQAPPDTDLAELDHRTGKLSDADYEELDRTLRGEAIAIMHDIDRATIDRQ